VAQQQLGQPVPGAHQISAAVLAGADQVPRSLLLDGRHGDGMNLTDAQQPGQVHGVLRVGLNAVTGWALQFRRRGHNTSDPGRSQRSVQPEPGWAGFVGHRDRPVQPADPRQDVIRRRRQPRLPQLARHTIDRRSDIRSGMDIQPNTRTLNQHRGLPRMSDRPSRQPLPGNPRNCASEAPAQPLTSERSLHTV
jgi:hypothetical protein